MCKRCLLPYNGEIQCEYCDLHDKMEAMPKSLGNIIIQVKQSGGKYNCLIGISGGFDSAILLDKALEWGLKPLVIHFDNGWNTNEAKHNIEQLTKKVDFITYRVNQALYDDVQKSLLLGGTPDADILNDLVMTEIMYRTAVQYKIKYILNGHNYRTEGSTPREWTYMDARYIESIYGKTVDLPIFRFWDQIIYSLLGIKQLRPFHHYDFNFEKEKERVMTKYSLQDYGGKHAENVMTDFIGSYLLPIKFGIDKRLVYLSAMVRSGYVKKEDVNLKAFDFGKLAEIDEFLSIKKIMQAPIRERSFYKRFPFKRYRLLIWLFVKMGALPYTFYKKYCK